MKIASGIEGKKVLFTELDIPPKVLKGVSDAGFVTCTPIQAMSLPLTLQGKDIAAQAQTGTGKTAAFLITIFSRLLGQKRRKKPGPYALIIAPTRELALQICEEARVLGGDTDFVVQPVFGGVDYAKQEKALRTGVDVVVATPGRLIDYMKQRVFSPENIGIVVVDEADRLFDMGFVKDLRFILRRLPDYTKRQSMLFSATLSYGVMELAYEHMNDAQEVFADRQRITVDEIDQALYHVGNDLKLSLLLGLLKKEKWSRVLIFANTRNCVDMLTRKLKGNDFPAMGITGTVHQKKRLKIMQQFKAGEIQILVATDVASRGIHVEDIDIVINYDIPQDPEDYVHRIGRTGRAGKAGRAITLACETYVYHLEAIEALIQERIRVNWASDDLFEKDHAAAQPRRKQPPIRRMKGRRPAKTPSDHRRHEPAASGRRTRKRRPRTKSPKTGGQMGHEKAR
jgi:ATP-dependent RNA helicase RhlB